ncbi:Pdf [Drosophila busckii]|uniref:Pdf n=1 Tax=Drosophila busckii TaxID=30019 RepID=A0A0M5JBY5_DROBS|nr:protein PDF [Drosophila busckii]ALC45431.1 Pdf [Drosophila busckii]
MDRNLLRLALLLMLSSMHISTLLADEERYMEKDFNRDLMDWLNNAARYAPIPVPASLCKYPYQMLNSLSMPLPMRLPKRNSELINSLLSLPKNMNEAGK